MSKNRGSRYEITENENHDECLFIPGLDDSGESDNDGSGDEDELDENVVNDSTVQYPSRSYSGVYDDYNNTQKKLEEAHEYVWKEGEKVYNHSLQNEIFFSEPDKRKISNSSPAEIFEFFFSPELKNYLIEATKENGYELSLTDLDTFLGIIIFSTYNKRPAQRDYWSTDPFLRSDIVCNSMSRDKFEKIKSSLKCSQLEDKNESDRVWRVRAITEIFNKNIKMFGYFCTAFSIDEMMVKYFGRCALKQFIRGKPIRFGIKLWALCSSFGYLFHFDIYCGKNETIERLANCALGSRVVMQMLEHMLKSSSPRKLGLNHIYFDNLFCSPDLLVHLKKVGLQATGTVRENRVNTKNVVDKKAPKGTYVVQHDQSSGINFITVQDSKPVSILSTAAGVSPLGAVKRYSKTDKQKKEIAFPNAFKNYNQFMGGVDLHDQYCNKVLPIFRSKKWTWNILMRIIQASITNATVLWNTVQPDKKQGIKEFAIEISKHYLQRVSLKTHELAKGTKRSYCSECKVRSWRSCEKCNDKYFCEPCLKKKH